MVRAIDAVQVLHNINLHHIPIPTSKFESGFNDGLNQAMWEITHAPTLTQPNEPMTLEEVAEILAEQCGGECACDVNGNDEWLPELCRYENVCPHHPEYLGCWMELLRNRNRRPPEGEEETP